MRQDIVDRCLAKLAELTLEAAIALQTLTQALAVAHSVVQVLKQEVNRPDDQGD